MAKSVKKPAAKPARDELFEQYWQQPDPSTLRVWADALIERGDPRGEYIQLCLLDAPTEEQVARREALDKKHHTKLAGPAREYLREFELGPNGLVARARTEADKLAEGLGYIGWLNPELALTVTSLDKKGAPLADCSLERIYHVSFAWGVIGSQGGSNLKDATLSRLAPALRRVRNLSLQCVGYGDKCFTPAGLRALGETVEAIEYLGLTYYNSSASPYAAAGRRGLAPIEDYARAIAGAPGFRSLKVVFLRGLADASILHALPNVAHVETLAHNTPGAWKSPGRYAAYELPSTPAELEPLKRGQYQERMPSK